MPVHGQKLQWIVGEHQPARGTELLRSLLPGITQRDHMVDLDSATRSDASTESDRFGRVRIT